MCKFACERCNQPLSLTFLQQCSGAAARVEMEARVALVEAAAYVSRGMLQGALL